jgi:MFS family permease
MPWKRWSGPWRAIPVLGPTQILAWGALFYPPVLVMPLIAAERDWSLAFCMGGFSLGLLMAGLVAPTVGGLIDRYGGHWVMAAGALVGALGVVALALTVNRVNYLAAWTAIGVAMAASLYDPAFATLGRIFGAEARRPITILTFIGGFASTVSWPATYVLIEYLGWKGAYLVFAALLAFVAAPLLAFALPRERFKARALAPGEVHAPPKTLPARGAVFILVIVAFSAYAFIPSAMSAHLLAIFDRLGIDYKIGVILGALFGPAQVLARLAEFLYAREIHPLVIARFAVALTLAGFALMFALGVSLWVALAFVVMFGVSNGLMTIARGTVPLVLFGAAGYGKTVGKIAGPSLVLQAAAPLVLAFVAERYGDYPALGVVALAALAAFIAFLLVRRP